MARRSAIKGYIDRLVDASGVQDFNQILSVLTGGQVYGREVYDHTIVGWADIRRVTMEEFPQDGQGNQKRPGGFVKLSRRHYGHYKRAETPGMIVCEQKDDTCDIGRFVTL